MSVITPSSEVTFVRSPLEYSGKHQLDFSNINVQLNYFENLTVKKIYSNCTYIRKDGYLQVNESYDNMLKFNYCFYKNPAFSEKIFYCFITGLEFLNPNCTKVYIKTDVFQTYMFDYEILNSYIERSHVPLNEFAGQYLFPEGLETGELVEQGSTSVGGLKPLCVIAYSRNPTEDELTAKNVGYMPQINGVLSGLRYFVASPYFTTSYMLDLIDIKGFGESVVSIFTIPQIAMYNFIDEFDNQWTPQYIESHYVYNPPYDPTNRGLGSWIYQSTKGSSIDISVVGRPDSLNGYTPKNKKLLTYPYTYLGFSPFNGSSKIFRYENFGNPANPQFRIMSEINPNPTVLLLPVDYHTDANVPNINEGCSMNGYPTISYYTTYFNSWQAQNMNIIDLNLSHMSDQYDLSTKMNTFNENKAQIQNIGSIGAGGGVVGTITSLATAGLEAGLIIQESELNQRGLYQNYEYEIQNQLLQVERQNLLPNPSSIGSSATLIGYDLNNQDIFQRYGIKSEFAQKIDNYFEMFGYKLNVLETPNTKSRKYWNYIKTININLKNNGIPQSDISELKNLYDSGITIWHNPLFYRDYSKDNHEALS